MNFLKLDQTKEEEKLVYLIRNQETYLKSQLVEKSGHIGNAGLLSSVIQ